MTPQMYVAPAVFVKLPEKKKKSACKIKENDLKIAWKCTLRQSNFKSFPGEAPRTPLMRGPLLYSPPLAAYAARYMPSAVNAPPSSDLLGPALLAQRCSIAFFPNLKHSRPFALNHITQTCLHNFDPLKPHLYRAKLEQGYAFSY